MFRAFFAFPKHFTGADGQPCNAAYGVAAMTLSLIEAHRPTHIFGARDMRGGTFRHEILEDYKSGRPPMPPEMASQIPLIYRFFEEGMGVPLLGRERFEADDVLATLAEHFRGQAGVEVLVYSGDADLLQLAGDNVRILRTRQKGEEILGPKEVQTAMGVPPERVPDYKALAGDSSDRLSGVPGIGPVGARKLLEEYGGLEELLAQVDALPKKFQNLLTEHAEHARITREMARLTRDVPLEVEENKAKLGGMPAGLLDFLGELSSQRLRSRAQKIFGVAGGQSSDAPPPEMEQVALF